MADSASIEKSLPPDAAAEGERRRILAKAAVFRDTIYHFPTIFKAKTPEGRILQHLRLCKKGRLLV